MHAASHDTNNTESEKHIFLMWCDVFMKYLFTYVHFVQLFRN